MIKSFYSKHRFAFKWIGIALLIKSCLFIFFAYHFYQNWPKQNIINTIFIASGDTWGYYDPCENFVNGDRYDSYCRMPGLLPVYTVLRLLFTAVWTKTFIILLQFLTSVLSVYVLALTAKRLFNNERMFYITFFIYAFSSFVSIWDHVGYADSFGVSFLIFSVYFLVVFKSGPRLKLLLWSSFFMTWSVFFRPLHGIFIPVIVIFYLLHFRSFIPSVKRILIYSLPLVICLGLWTFKNYRASGRIIVLQGPMSECFPGLSEQLLSIRKLVISWGDDVQPWAKGTAGEWFFSTRTHSANALPTAKDVYTKAYTPDSLIKLREYYFLSLNDTLPERREYYKNYVIAQSERYTKEYQKEKPFSAYVLNKFVLLKRLLLPGRLDDLPFPAFDKMNLLQKLIKSGYFLLLLIVNILGFAGSIYLLFKRNPIGMIPLSIIAALILVFGIVEQRYLVPVYPYFVIFTAFLLVECYGYLKRRKAAQVD